MKNWLKRLFVAVVFTTLLVGTASAQDAQTSKYFKLKISTETGELKKVNDENDRDAKQLNPQELEQFYQSDYVYTGAIFYTHQSPGCVIVIIGGKAFKICHQW